MRKKRRRKVATGINPPYAGQKCEAIERKDSQSLPHLDWVSHTILLNIVPGDGSVGSF